MDRQANCQGILDSSNQGWRMNTKELMALVSEYGQVRWCEGQSSGRPSVHQQIAEQFKREEAFDLYQRIEQAVNELAAQPSIDVDELAQAIRVVDGSHSLGAGALAEALTPFICAQPDHSDASKLMPEFKKVGEADFHMSAMMDIVIGEELYIRANTKEGKSE
jgi:hypothetical protein